MAGEVLGQLEAAVVVGAGDPSHRLGVDQGGDVAVGGALRGWRGWRPGSRGCSAVARPGRGSRPGPGATRCSAARPGPGARPPQGAAGRPRRHRRLRSMVVRPRHEEHGHDRERAWHSPRRVVRDTCGRRRRGRGRSAAAGRTRDPGRQAHGQVAGEGERRDEEADRELGVVGDGQTGPHQRHTEEPTQMTMARPGVRQSRSAMAPGTTSRLKISSTPTTWTAAVTATARTRRKPTDRARTGTPRASATSSSSEANSSGR